MNFMVEAFIARFQGIFGLLTGIVLVVLAWHFAETTGNIYIALCMGTAIVIQSLAYIILPAGSLTYPIVIDGVEHYEGPWHIHNSTTSGKILFGIGVICGAGYIELLKRYY